MDELNTDDDNVTAVREGIHGLARYEEVKQLMDDPTGAFTHRLYDHDPKGVG